MAKHYPFTLINLDECIRPPNRKGRRLVVPGDFLEFSKELKESGYTIIFFSHYSSDQITDAVNGKELQECGLYAQTEDLSDIKATMTEYAGPSKGFVIITTNLELTIYADKLKSRWISPTFFSGQGPNPETSPDNISELKRALYRL